MLLIFNTFLICYLVHPVVMDIKSISVCMNSHAIKCNYVKCGGKGFVVFFFHPSCCRGPELKAVVRKWKVYYDEWHLLFIYELIIGAEIVCVCCTLRFTSQCGEIEPIWKNKAACENLYICDVFKLVQRSVREEAFKAITATASAEVIKV